MSDINFLARRKAMSLCRGRVQPVSPNTRLDISRLLQAGQRIIGPM